MKQHQKLNGWQRLWVLVSVCLLLPALYLSYMTRPTRDSILDDWAEQLVAFSVDHDSSLASYSPAEIIQKYKNIPSREFIDRYSTTYAVRHPEFKPQLDSISNCYQDQLDKFETQTVVHFLKALAIWFGLIFVLYLSGGSIAWVYRGFKQGSGPA